MTLTQKDSVDKTTTECESMKNSAFLQKKQTPRTGQPQTRARDRDPSLSPGSCQLWGCPMLSQNRIRKGKNRPCARPNLGQGWRLTSPVMHGSHGPPRMSRDGPLTLWASFMRETAGHWDGGHSAGQMASTPLSWEMATRGPEEPWQLNAARDPGLDPGVERKTGKICLKSRVWLTAMCQCQFLSFDQRKGRNWSIGAFPGLSATFL